MHLSCDFLTSAEKNFKNVLWTFFLNKINLVLLSFNMLFKLYVQISYSDSICNLNLKVTMWLMELRWSHQKQDISIEFYLHCNGMWSDRIKENSCSIIKYEKWYILYITSKKIIFKKWIGELYLFCGALHLIPLKLLQRDPPVSFTPTHC